MMQLQFVQPQFPQRNKGGCGTAQRTPVQSESFCVYTRRENVFAALFFTGFIFLLGSIALVGQCNRHSLGASSPPGRGWPLIYANARGELQQSELYTKMTQSAEAGTGTELMATRFTEHV